MSYFSNVLKGEMFVENKQKDESSSEEDISFENSIEDDVDDDEYTDTESEDEEIDVGVDDYCKDSQNSETMNSMGSRLTRGNKPAPRKKNHNNLEKHRRTQLAMCYDALREAIGYPNVSRKKALELMMEGLDDLVDKIAVVNREIRLNEEIIKAHQEERRRKGSR